MYKDALRAAWAEINISNLDYNIKNIIKKVGPGKKITGVIKSDAYGHGAVKVATVLRANGITSFAVATLSEAIRLRNSGFMLEEIIILSPTPVPCVDTLVEHRLSPVISDYQTALEISTKAKQEGIMIKGYIAIDTGMRRIGYNPDDPASIDEVKMISNLPAFKIRGLFSHFANSSDPNKSFPTIQEQRFMFFYKKLLKAGIKIPVRTLSNSGAIMEITSAHYDMVRCGIILYGGYPDEKADRSQLDLRPVMSIKSNIIALRTVPAGTSISYGRKFVTNRDSIIATIPIGYADGLPRIYSDKGRVIVNGVFAPIVGSICMDMCMIDVTNVPYARLGDEVTIMGKDGIREITADDIANSCKTINYEIFTSFGQRLPKVYIY